MIPIRDRNPTTSVPVTNYVLIGLNVFGFLWQQAAASVGYSRVALDWGFIPSAFARDPISHFITIFTAMFLHAGWLHIGGNMLFLWVFGDNVEDAIGHWRYLAFYLVGGVAAAMGQLAANPAAIVPMIGASGAIAAVLAAYLTLFPRAPVLVLFPIFVIFMFFEFPAWLVILEWFALQLIEGVGALASLGKGAGVAWFAHLGGFITGLILIRLFMIGRQTKTYEAWRGWNSARGSRFMRGPHPPRTRYRATRRPRRPW